MIEGGFSHRLLFYADEDEFLAATVPHLRVALEAGQPALAVVRPARAAALKGELGADAAGVGFVDVQAVGRNPGRLIPLWREFFERTGGRGRPLRGIGEPVWPGRTAAELDECHRHEHLLNRAFAGAPGWSLLCPYDSSSLGFDVLQAAARCHPVLAKGEYSRSNPACTLEPAPATFLTGSLPSPPRATDWLEFDRDGLNRVRGRVATHAAEAQLSPSRGSDLVSAASEIAANSVRHGGGRGRLGIWRGGRELMVEFRDSGRIDEPLVGRRRPGLAQLGGRGVWLAHQLCDLVQVRSGPGGSTIRLRMGLN